MHQRIPNISLSQCAQTKTISLSLLKCTTNMLSLSVPSHIIACVDCLVGFDSRTSNLPVYGRYEQRYMDDVKIKTAEKEKDTEVKEVSSGETSSKTADEITKPKSNNTEKKASDQDLDAFLLGDLEDGDDGPGTLMNH